MMARPAVYENPFLSSSPPSQKPSKIAQPTRSRTPQPQQYLQQQDRATTALPRLSNASDRPSSSHSLFRVLPTKRERISLDCISVASSLTTEEDAAWYLSLPPKARRHQFSTDEQRLLAQHCRRILSSAASSTASTTSPAPDRLARRSDSIPELAAHLPKRLDRRQASLDLKPSATDVRAAAATHVPRPVHSPPLSDGASRTRHVDARDFTRGSWRHPALKPVALPPPKLAPALSSIALERPRAGSPAAPLSSARNFSTPYRTFFVDSSGSSSRVPSPRLSGSRMRSDDATATMTTATITTTTTTLRPEGSLHSETGSSSRAGPPTSVPTSPSLTYTEPTSPQLPAFLDGQDEDDRSVSALGPITPEPLMPEEADTFKEVIAHVDDDEGLDFQHHHHHLSATTIPAPSAHRQGSLASWHDSGRTVAMDVDPPMFKFPDTRPPHMEALFQRDRRHPSMVDHHHHHAPSATSSAPPRDPLYLDDIPICDDETGAHGAFAVQQMVQRKGLKKVLSGLRAL